MPLALDPAQTFELVLETDKAKSPGKRPTFVFRYGTDRELLELRRRQQEAAAEEPEAVANVRLMHEILQASLVGWRNMTDRSGQTIRFDASKTPDILNALEVMELLEGIGAHVHPSVADRKNSESPSPAGTAGSARRVRGTRKRAKRARRR